MEKHTNPEVVIVGAGIGGSALATVLARAGIAVTLLEKSLVHVDHVRGEWLAPWGVAETQRLGLYETLARGGRASSRRATSHTATTSIPPPRNRNCSI